jgi:hypothetical protein
MTELTQDIMDRLSEPFEPSKVEWKPQATSGNRALAIAYADARAYQDRLNEVAGADWTDEYQVLDGGAVVLCKLTIGGVTRSDIGEADPKDRNTATSALSQAFKRAAVKFGLGRYLYDLPAQWVDYNPKKRRFTPKAKRQLRATLEGRSNGNGNGHGPAVFKSPKAAWKWGLKRGAFTELDEAAAVYANVKRKAAPQSAEEMAKAWKAKIEEILSKQERLEKRLN